MEYLTFDTCAHNVRVVFKLSRALQPTTHALHALCSTTQSKASRVAFSEQRSSLINVCRARVFQKRINSVAFRTSAKAMAPWLPILLSKRCPITNLVHCNNQLIAHTQRWCRSASCETGFSSNQILRHCCDAPAPPGDLTHERIILRWPCTPRLQMPRNVNLGRSNK